MQDTPPSLKNRQAFEQILATYRVSERAKNMLAKTPFVALSGVAGGGRNTVIKYLVEHDNFGFIVSDTTRPPKLRDGVMEVDGVNYHFRDETAMLDDLENGEFIEAELIHNQQVSGTSIREVERIVAEHKIPISDYEFGGANAVAEAKPDASIIGLLPPSYEEWIRRLSGREEMSEGELRNRFETAKIVLENMLSKPYFEFVINKTVEQCAEDIRYIVDHPGENRETEPARAVANDLLRQVNEFLGNKTA
jgi:guanylate kinase